MTTFFHHNLLALNDLSRTGFREWLFLPSMLFEAQDKWWGDRGKRTVPHEGIDISMYRTTAGVVAYLTGGTRVPAVFTGRIEKIIDDFLGKSVFVRSEQLDNEDGRFFTLYGHIEPSKDNRPGKVIDEGNVIGLIAGGKRTSVRPHLHISFARIPESLPVEELNWEAIGERRSLRLIDPLDIITIPHSVIVTDIKTGGE